MNMWKNSCMIMWKIIMYGKRNQKNPSIIVITDNANNGTEGNSDNENEIDEESFNRMLEKFIFLKNQI